ncbi:MAG TPA: hypothetical protein IAA99_07905 [Candidatus Avibacteroides faecavium]|nr:hypothetical protein [Candidatus Avibacteroides faecavium]
MFISPFAPRSGMGLPGVRGTLVRRGRLTAFLRAVRRVWQMPQHGLPDGIRASAPHHCMQGAKTSYVPVKII